MGRGLKQKLQACAAEVLHKAGQESLPETLVVLGSGFSGFTKDIKEPLSIDLHKLTGFPVPKVAGHGSALVIGKVGKVPVAVLSGRVHTYEGYSASEVVHSIRVMYFAGAKRVILTNASGGLDKKFKPGTVVVISDQINLTGQSCLIGSRELGAEFQDMSEVYDARWAKKIKKADAAIKSGIYVGLAGPAYETPAEAKFFRLGGGDVVGMSTVQEAMAARQLGMKVAGLSFVTNMSGGMGEILDHADVLALAKKNASRLAKILNVAVQS